MSAQSEMNSIVGSITGIFGMAASAKSMADKTLKAELSGKKAQKDSIKNRFSTISNKETTNETIVEGEKK